jgi:hypothetical protein
MPQQLHKFAIVHSQILSVISGLLDRLCGIVVRGPGSIPGATGFS